MRRSLVILISIASPGLAQEKVTFDDHVFSIFQQSCLNCHNPDKTKGGLDLSSFAGTLKGSSGGKIVEAGDVNSSLIAVLQQTSEPKMPPEGDKLSSGQIDILRKWIEGGLLENKSSSARKPSKPKFETALRSDPAAKPEGPPPMPKDLLLEPPVITDRPAAIRSIATSPWASLLAVTSQRQVLLHHTQTLDLVGILPFPEGEPVSLNFTPDGRYLLVGGGVPGKSGLTVTFNITTGARLLTAGKEFDTILASDIRPGFDIVATGGPSRLLKLWNTETGELLKSVKKHTDWITALDLSTDGVLLASGDRNGGVWVWESEACSEFHTLRGHQAAITGISFRSDSNVLATASEDGKVIYWEMNGGSELKKVEAHPGGVTAFAFGRDGSSVTAGRDMKAKLWKPDFSQSRDLAQALPALPTAAALDFESKRAFIADAQGVIRVYQTSDGKTVGEIHANPPSIEMRLQKLASQIESLEPKASEESVTTQLKALRISQNLWSAAAINTRVLATRRLADEQAIKVEESQLDFSQLAAAVTTQAEILNEKRASANSLLRQREQTLSSEVLAEIEATHAAIQIRIDQEAVKLQQAEAAVMANREKIEKSAPLAHRNHREFQQLKSAYLQALNVPK